MENENLVSVIIPTYNRQKLVLRSMKSIINQTYKKLEIIIVDDGSTDNTELEVKKIIDDRIIFLKNESNMGVSFSRNKGIKKAKGKFIVLQDSDDESLPERIEEQLKVLNSCSLEFAAAYCGKILIDSKTGEIFQKQLRETDFKLNFTKGSYILTPGTGVLMIRKSVFKDVGYFDENMRARVDTEWAIRVSKIYKFAFVNNLLVKVYRYHNQIGTDVVNQNRAKEIIIEKHSSFLSEIIVYNLHKMIINYYLISKNHKMAKEYLIKLLKIKITVIDLLLLFGIIMFPQMINFAYNLKYKGAVPLTGGVKGTKKIFNNE